MKNIKEMRNKIGDFVRVKRAELKINQTELSERSGVTLRTVQKVEAGVRVKEDSLTLILSALGYDIVWDVDFVKKENK